MHLSIKMLGILKAMQYVKQFYWNPLDWENINMVLLQQFHSFCEQAKYEESLV